MNPFFFHTRDRYGRPVRHFDWDALTIVLLGTTIATLLVVYHDLALVGGKIVARLVAL